MENPVFGVLLVLAVFLIARQIWRSVRSDRQNPTAPTGLQPDVIGPSVQSEGPSKIYEIADRLAGFYKIVAYPEELERHPVFREGVAHFCSPEVSERDVVRFAAGENALVSCMANAALRERTDSVDARNAILDSVGTIAPFSQFFALKFLASATPPDKRVIGPVLAVTTHYLYSRVSRNCLEEFVRRRVQMGEPLEFGPEISVAGLQALRRYLGEIDPEIGGPLLASLDDHKSELFKKAEAGDVEAQYALASFPELSDDEQEQWLTRAAEGGHVEAQYELGSQANNNIGWVFDSLVQHFVEDARKWLRRAAENGHAAACMELAEVEILSRYHDPIGVAEGAEWYKRGRKLGHEHDPWMLDIPLSSHPPFPKIPKTVVLDRSGAKRGDIRAQFDVGCFCAHGRSDMHMIDAYAWFCVAARDLRDKSFDEIFRMPETGGLRARVRVHAARSAKLLEKIFSDEEKEKARKLAEKYLNDYGRRPWWKEALYLLIGR